MLRYWLAAAIMLLLTGCQVSAPAGQAAYGSRVAYAPGQPVDFPDFTLEFVGTRRVTSPQYPRGFLYYDFTVASGDEQQTVAWTSGTGDIGPQEFKVGDKVFLLELVFSETLGRLDENELVIIILETHGENTGGGFGVAGRVINGGRAIYGEAMTGWAGWFNGSVTITGACTGCLQASFAVNVGAGPLQPGDVVTVRGVTAADFDNAPLLWEVLPAQAGQAAVGVVAGRATPITVAHHLPSENGRQLLPGEGAAAPGEYVTIIYSGPARLASDVGVITAGARVTIAADGRVRPLQTRTVAGMLVAEGAPVLGVTLGEAQDGLVWVLVNPQ